MKTITTVGILISMVAFLMHSYSIFFVVLLNLILVIFLLLYNFSNRKGNKLTSKIILGLMVFNVTFYVIPLSYLPIYLKNYSVVDLHATVDIGSIESAFMINQVVFFIALLVLGCASLIDGKRYEGYAWNLSTVLDKNLDLYRVSVLIILIFSTLQYVFDWRSGQAVWTAGWITRFLPLSLSYTFLTLFMVFDSNSKRRLVSIIVFLFSTYIQASAGSRAAGFLNLFIFLILILIVLHRQSESSSGVSATNLNTISIKRVPRMPWILLASITLAAPFLYLYATMSRGVSLDQTTTVFLLMQILSRFHEGIINTTVLFDQGHINLSNEISMNLLNGNPSFYIFSSFFTSLPSNLYSSIFPDYVSLGPLFKAIVYNDDYFRTGGHWWSPGGGFLYISSSNFFSFIILVLIVFILIWCQFFVIRYLLPRRGVFVCQIILFTALLHLFWTGLVEGNVSFLGSSFQLLLYLVYAYVLEITRRFLLCPLRSTVRREKRRF